MYKRQPTGLVFPLEGPSNRNQLFVWKWHVHKGVYDSRFTSKFSEKFNYFSWVPFANIKIQIQMIGKSVHHRVSQMLFHKRR